MQYPSNAQIEEVIPPVLADDLFKLVSSLLAKPSIATVEGSKIGQELAFLLSSNNHHYEIAVLARFYALTFIFLDPLIFLWIIERFSDNTYRMDIHPMIFEVAATLPLDNRVQFNKADFFEILESFSGAIAEAYSMTTH